MAETTPTGRVRANPSAGHLSVQVEGAHPADVPFLFEQQRQRVPAAAAASLTYHVLVVVGILLLIRYGSHAPVEAAPEQPVTHIVWLAEPGPGGGGGGGGNQMKEPPRKADLPGKDKISVPVVKPPKIDPPKQAKVEPNPIEQLSIPARSLAAATEALPGMIEAPPGPPTVSQGTGTGGGSGTGTGPGMGPGSGSGLGPGSGGGTGGGVYQPGNGVTLPKVLREVKPQYTSDAMRAKIQGTVLISCVVMPDGSVSDVHVVRSLDPTFGLDQEAMKAARAWKFAPGMRLGEPVPVQISIELTFTLR